MWCVFALKETAYMFTGAITTCNKKYVSVNVEETYFIKMPGLWFLWTLTGFNISVAVTIGY